MRANLATAVALLTACGLLAIPAATAKDVGPGDLRVCGRSHCVPIMNRRLVRILNAYYWGPRPVIRAGPVRRGAPAFALRWRDGYVSGLVAGADLNRFRAHGFFCERFVRGRWYRFRAEATVWLKKLTTQLRPLRVYAPPPSC